MDPSTQREVPLKVSRETVRAIANAHPRFGATIANLNAFGFYAGSQHVYWTPVPIIADDIDAFLSRQENPDFFNQLNGNAKKLNRLIQEGSLAEIVYDVTVSAPETNPRVIKLQMRKPVEVKKPALLNLPKEPPLYSLEISIIQKGINALTLAKEPQVETWHVE